MRVSKLSVRPAAATCRRGDEEPADSGIILTA